MEVFITNQGPGSPSDPLTRLLAAILAWLRALLAEHQATLLASHQQRSPPGNDHKTAPHGQALPRPPCRRTPTHRPSPHADAPPRRGPPRRGLPCREAPCCEAPCCEAPCCEALGHDGGPPAPTPRRPFLTVIIQNQADPTRRPHPGSANAASYPCPDNRSPCLKPLPAGSAYRREAAAQTPAPPAPAPRSRPGTSPAPGRTNAAPPTDHG